MKVLAIVASPRKGKSTDTLVDRAVAGLRSGDRKVKIEKVNLYDFDIQFCKNCLVCRDRETDEDFSPCIIKDGMNELYPKVMAADALIFGTPLHMGYPPGILMTFLERLCWTFGKPEGKVLTVYGCPVPRSSKERSAVIIITNGIIPPMYRRFCDDTTKAIKQTIRDSLNARTVGSLYAGDIENRGLDPYLERAENLGKKLSR